MLRHEMARVVATEVMGWHDHDGRWCYFVGPPAEITSEDWSHLHRPVGFRVAKVEQDHVADGFFRPDECYFQVHTIVTLVRERFPATVEFKWKPDESREYSFNDGSFSVGAEQIDVGDNSLAVVVEAIIEYWRFKKNG